MFKKLNAKGFSHHLLLFIIPLVAVAAIGAYVISASRASGGFVCTVGPVFTDGAGTTDGGVMNDGQQWYSVVLQNRTGTATSTLNDIAFQGKSSSGSTFTWNAQTYDGKYIDWLKGFSGVKILNNGTVQGQVRKPSTPAGVGQANWSVIVKGATYSCNTTTNINTTYNQLVKDATTANATPVPTTTTPVATTPPPTTSSPTPVTTLPVLPTYTCTNLKLLSTGSYGNRYQVLIKNTSSVTMNLNQFKFRAPSPSVSVDTPSGGTLAQNAQLNATFDSTAPITAGWYGAYVVDSSNTVRVTCSTTSVPVTAAPSPTGTSPSDPIVNPVTDPTVGNTDSTNPTSSTDASGNNAPVPVSAPKVRPPANAKIADLGYVPSLHCVKVAKSTYTTSSCADANGIMLIVTGTEKTPSKNLLTYDIDVLATHDTFGSVNGCAARTLIVSGKAKKFDCTVVYTDKSFFAGLKQSVLNKFKSIVANAKADTFLNKSEAAAAIAKLKKEDALTKGVAISMAYKGYATERSQGNLVFDYNEASAILTIKNIQAADCKAAGGTFVSTTVGCNLPSSSPDTSGTCKKGYVKFSNGCIAQAVLDKAQAAADAANAAATHPTTTTTLAVAKQPKSVNCSGKGSLTHIGSSFTGLFWSTFTISPPPSAVLSNYPAFSDLTCFAYNWVSGSRDYSLPNVVF